MPVWGLGKKKKKKKACKTQITVQGCSLIPRTQTHTPFMEIYLLLLSEKHIKLEFEVSIQMKGKIMLY